MIFYRISLSIIFFLFFYTISSANGLIGGKTDKKNFPEVIRIGGCSATIVGPKVLVTAAHCTRYGSIRPFYFKNEKYKARCKNAPEYNETIGDQDMAFCATDKIMKVDKYASLLNYSPEIDETITLAGYGCINHGGGGGNDGKLRVGNAPVTRLATDRYFSFHTEGDVAVCYGDSGGPAFKETSDKDEDHLIYGIISRGNISTSSLLTAVYHPLSIEFALDFEERYDVEICGVSKSC